MGTIFEVIKRENFHMLRLIILIIFLSFGFNLHAQIALSQKYIQELEKEYTTGLFKSENAHTLIPMDDPGATGAITIFQYLQGRIPGVFIYNTSSALFQPIVVYRNARPAFFLDEIQVDAGILTSVNVNDIALVKVFRPPFMGAFGGGSGGAIAVYTKKGTEDDGDSSDSPD